jgi:tellurite resistance protein TehA-like permease
MRLGWFARVDPPADVFAVAMATGIVAVAASYHAYWRIGLGLRVLVVAACLPLAIGFAARALTEPGRVVRLVRDPDVAFRMFTFVAACAVTVACWPNQRVADASLDGIGLLGWLMLMPLACVDVCHCGARQLRDRAHGAWLLPSVATQGLAATTADVAQHSHSWVLLLIATAAWVLGLLLYLAVSALIAWRALSAPFLPDAVTPDSWILMGALAIAALAAGRIFTAARALEAAPLAAWAQAGTWWTWALASAWIPVLLYAEMWCIDHLVGSLHYQGVWWAAVFPIGMYSAATARTATVLDIRALTTVSLVFFWIALTLWVLVAIGLTHNALSGWIRRPSNPRTATSAPVAPASGQGAAEAHRRSSRSPDRGPRPRSPDVVWRGSPRGLKQWVPGNTCTMRSEHGVGGGPADWRDRLVELHVLAQSGDDQAGAAAEHWMARDATARTLWHTVEQDCARLRGSDAHHRPTARDDTLSSRRVGPEAAAGAD